MSGHKAGGNVHRIFGFDSTALSGSSSSRNAVESARCTNCGSPLEVVCDQIGRSIAKCCGAQLVIHHVRPEPVIDRRRRRTR